MPYYHGSPIAGIETLAPSPGKPLYLTDNRAYALFYLRDPEINWVTCGVRGGIVAYDEQFPGQLRALYAGRGGWLYACGDDGGFVPGGSSWIVTADRAVPVVSAEFIPDAYEAILREISTGTVRVERYEDKTEKQKHEIFRMMVHYIFKRDLLATQTPKARFVERRFSEAWHYAVQNTASAEEYIARWEREHF